MSLSFSGKIPNSGLVAMYDVANKKGFFGDTTTNLALFTVADGFSSDAPANIVTSTDTSVTYKGRSSLRIIASNGYWNLYKNSTSYYTQTSSTTFTYSWKMKRSDGAAPNISGYIYTVAVSTYPSVTVVPIEDGWYQCYCTYNSTNSTLSLTGFNSSQLGIFYITDWQVETKTYYTPYAYGTRGTTVATGGGLYDLSQNNNHGGLNNGPLYNSDGGGSLVFDGSDDFSNSGTTPALLQGNPNITVIGYFKRTNSFSLKGFWGIGGSNAGGTGQGICNWNYNNTNEIAIDSWGQSTFTTGQTYPLNTWAGVCWRKVEGPMTRANCVISTFNGKNITNYTGAGLTILRSEASTNLAINSIGGLTVGSISVDTGYCSPVNLGNIAFYNRVLSDSEVTRYFLALKGRFRL